MNLSADVTPYPRDALRFGRPAGLLIAFFLLAAVSLVQGETPILSDSYTLVVGNAYINRIDLYDISREGGIAFRSDFAIGDDFPEFPEPWDMVFSREGNYCFFYDWDFARGALYRITVDQTFRFMRSIQYGCGGGGFTMDEKYLFSVMNCAGALPTTYTLVAFELKGELSDLVTSQSISHLYTLSGNYQVTSTDEVMASSRFGSNPNAFTSYQYDRLSHSFYLRQQIPGVYCLFTDLSLDENLILHAVDTKIGILQRERNLPWEVNSDFWNPQWETGTTAWTTFLTPDIQFAIVMLNGRNDSGPAVFRLLADGQLELTTLNPRWRTEAMALSPDGKYLAVSWDYSRQLTVFRFQPSTPYLEEVATIPTRARISCMQFMPQAIPREASAEREWSLY